MTTGQKWFRGFAILIFLLGLSTLHPKIKREAKALFTGYGLRNEEPARDKTYRFKKRHSETAGAYFLFLPKDRKAELPLVVALHGATGKAYAAEYLSRSLHQRKHPSYILIPDHGPRS